MIMLTCHYFVHQMTCCLFGELDFGSDIHKHWHSVSVQFSILKHVIKTICLSSASNLNIMSKSGLFTLFPPPPSFTKCQNLAIGQYMSVSSDSLNVSKFQMLKSGHWSVSSDTIWHLLISKWPFFPNLKLEWTIQPHSQVLESAGFLTSARGADAQHLSNKT